jgi:transposase InsO family protein
LCQSFNGKLWDELMNTEVFTTLLEARTLIGDWRRESNEIRPYSSLGCRPPAPEATQPALTLATLTYKVVSLLGRVTKKLSEMAK